MGGDSFEDRMDAYLRERADQPFGDVEGQVQQTLEPFSTAGLAAADNLLAKAERALSAGDTDRMTRLVDRATQLSYDRREETAPAAMAASQLLYDAVTDVVEDSPAGDTRWLDAAVEVLASTSGWGQAELRRTLVVIQQVYEIDRRESRTIDEAVATVPEREELIDAGLESRELADAATSVLRVVHAYRTAVDARDD